VGKQTAFTYDGLDRRTKVVSTPSGGGAVTTGYVWCGSRICQARNGSSAVTRSYHIEGEYVPGSPGQPYYYGANQLGSVRRVFASTTNAPAYGYDPYGIALQVTAPVTDFGYAGMLHNADSGLYLTQYRAYDPTNGRWLSRDPIGEDSNRAGNLYAYVESEPISSFDPRGLDGIKVAFVGYMVDTGLGFSAPLGHSAVIAVDPATGGTSYYDFGRYGGQYGDVRDMGSVGQVSFDANGNPTAASLEKVYQTASELYGKGSPVYAEYYKDADYEKLRNFARDRASNLQDYPYSLPFNTCKNFPVEAIAAAGGTPGGKVHVLRGGR